MLNSYVLILIQTIHMLTLPSINFKYEINEIQDVALDTA